MDDVVKVALLDLFQYLGELARELLDLFYMFIRFFFGAGFIRFRSLRFPIDFLLPAFSNLLLLFLREVFLRSACFGLLVVGILRGLVKTPIVTPPPTVAGISCYDFHPPSDVGEPIPLCRVILGKPSQPIGFRCKVVVLFVLADALKHVLRGILETYFGAASHLLCLPPLEVMKDNVGLFSRGGHQIPYHGGVSYRKSISKPVLSPVRLLIHELL